MLRHPCILGGPQQREQNQKSKPTLGVTMMHHATKRGFKDCPGFLNSTGRLGPKRGRKCYITPAFSGVPNKGGQNQNSKAPLRVTMMPLGAIFGSQNFGFQSPPPPPFPLPIHPFGGGGGSMFQRKGAGLMPAGSVWLGPLEWPEPESRLARQRSTGGLARRSHRRRARRPPA